jgi:hypothetical protein
MFKEVVVFVLGALILIFLISQIILPLFTKLDFFWLFNSDEENRKNKLIPANSIKDLDDLDKEATAKTEAYKETLGALKQTEQKIADIREKTKL